MWSGHTVSVILPTYNERDSIRQIIREFEQTGCVDEIIVINNNAAEGTAEEVEPTSAIQIFESTQGYGAAIQRGFREATGDYLFVCEPDGTFAPKDVIKFLAYLDDFDMVIGTRTSREFIWEGANMGLMLKWGNWAVAKMLEFLFNTTLLTDVGCTYRAIKRSALMRIWDRFEVKGSHFGPEMMLHVVLNGIRFTEIPVNYKKRVGVSSVTGSKLRAIVLGFTMIGMILKFRAVSWLGGYHKTPKDRPAGQVEPQPALSRIS
ncbi:MAG: glycosyltransferase family 2 protein [Phycisphaerae bacterium]|nr:glycosyltransferase family 2 protein [Phycisphaerae bacterium]